MSKNNYPVAMRNAHSSGFGQQRHSRIVTDASIDAAVLFDEEEDADDLERGFDDDTKSAIWRAAYHEANRILRDADSGDIVNETRACFFPQFINPFEARLEGTIGDLKNVYEPKSSDVQKASTAVDSKHVCENCGDKMSKFGGRICRECYRNRAKSNYARRIAVRTERAEKADAKYQGAALYLGLYADGTGWESTEPDFSLMLIEQISEVEEQTGIPIAFADTY